MLRKHGNKMENLCFALRHVNKNRFVDFHPPEFIQFCSNSRGKSETAMRSIFEFVIVYKFLINFNVFYNRRNLKNAHKL